MVQFDKIISSVQTNIVQPIYQKIGNSPLNTKIAKLALGILALLVVVKIYRSLAGRTHPTANQLTFDQIKKLAKNEQMAPPSKMYPSKTVPVE